MILAGLLSAMLVAAFPPASPNSINLEIGGVVSGPSRRYVDLEKGLLLIGRPPNGTASGDAAGVSTSDLSVSDTVHLTQAQAAQLRELAQAVVLHGAEAKEMCHPSADRIIKLDIRIDTGAISGLVYCPSADVERLMNSLWRIAEVR